VSATSTDTTPVPRLKAKYEAEIRAALKEQLGLGNIMQVPRLDKIVLNMGVGAAVGQPSLLEGAVKDLTTIAGQKPIITKAKKSIAGFKLREGNAIGTKVTLRGARMWEFLDRLISLAIPRIRDFRGLDPNAFDGRGNYTFGVTSRSSVRDRADGQEGTHREAAAHSEVQGPRLHPLQALRPTALGLPQVRPVPCLPARARARRGDPGRHEGELVRGDRP